MNTKVTSAQKTGSSIKVWDRNESIAATVMVCDGGR